MKWQNNVCGELTWRGWVVYLSEDKDKNWCAENGCLTMVNCESQEGAIKAAEESQDVWDEMDEGLMYG